MDINKELKDDTEHNTTFYTWAKQQWELFVNTMLQASNLKGRQMDITWTAACVKMKEKV